MPHRRRAQRRYHCRRFLLSSRQAAQSKEDCRGRFRRQHRSRDAAGDTRMNKNSNIDCITLVARVLFVRDRVGTMLFALALCAVSALAQNNTERGIMVREAELYVSPDSQSQKLATVGRGREIAVMDRS